MAQTAYPSQSSSQQMRSFIYQYKIQYIREMKVHRSTTHAFWDGKLVGVHLSIVVKRFGLVSKPQFIYATSSLGSSAVQGVPIAPEGLTSVIETFCCSGNCGTSAKERVCLNVVCFLWRNYHYFRAIIIRYSETGKISFTNDVGPCKIFPIFLIVLQQKIIIMNINHGTNQLR